jgi:hypothetical protein
MRRASLTSSAPSTSRETFCVPPSPSNWTPCTRTGAARQPLRYPPPGVRLPLRCACAFAQARTAAHSAAPLMRTTPSAAPKAAPAVLLTSHVANVGCAGLTACFCALHAASAAGGVLRDRHKRLPLHGAKVELPAGQCLPQ